MRNLRRHANALAQRRMPVNRLVDVHYVSAHLDDQRNLADQVAARLTRLPYRMEIGFSDRAPSNCTRKTSNE